MAEVKWVDEGNGQYTIHAAGVTIEGDLTVNGTQTSAGSSTINDQFIIVNNGEAGAGISGGTAGLTADRGSLADVSIRYNETTDIWEFTNDGTTYFPMLTSGNFDLINDLSPQAGGDLDLNGFSIVNFVSNDDIILLPNGTGEVFVQANALKLETQGSDPAAPTTETKIFAKAPGQGDSGVYFINNAKTDELVSRRKALIYGIIF